MRPNNFWDVLSETASYAGEAIPAAQRENRQIAQERERFGLRAQQERDQFNETRRYHDAQIGLRGARMNAQQHPTSHPSFDQVYADILLHPENYDPQVVKDFKEANSERHPGRAEPQPKVKPNFVGDIQGDYEKKLGQWTNRRKDVVNTPTDQVDPKTGYAIPMKFTEPEPTLEGSYRLQAGMFPQYGVDPDSVRNELGLQVLNRRTNAPGLRPGAPSSNIGDLRRMDRVQSTGGYGPDRTFPTEKEYLDAKAMGLVD